MRRPLLSALLIAVAVAAAINATALAGSGSPERGAVSTSLASHGGSAGAARAGSTPARLAVGPPRPPIRMLLIPFPPRRLREMAAYARRHYGIDSWRLVHPHVIVEHYSVTSSVQAVYDTFAPDVPDSELHELPGTCAHFVIGRDGTIYQLVPLGIMCRHTVGLNWTAIGIEHVGFSDAQVLGDRRQLAASLALTRWLRCRYGIPVADVIGHNESLSSPYHHELVPALRHQTHSDFRHASMVRYRAALARLGGCGS